MHKLLMLIKHSRRKKAQLLYLIAIVLFVAGSGGIQPKPAAAVTNDCNIGAGDQASHQILVFDPNVTDWNSSSALMWSWSPSASNGFSNPTPGWGQPTDMKLRSNCSLGGGQWMAVTDTSGLAAIISYPGGSKKWYQNTAANLQSAELLPNGNIAIASTSSGGWVRVYNSSQGASSSAYDQYVLVGARGVLWDPLKNVLWAVGDNDLVALLVQGSPAAPTLKESFKVALPSSGGHELQPVYGNKDRLWVSSDTLVYQYIKSTKTWSSTYSGASSISRAGVRSVGNQLSGQAVETVPGGGCTLNSWCTDTVDFLSPGTTRVKTGAAFYKARILNPEYQ
ncbi:hypothetical protein GCM10010911_72080 [Paenibacillus nasutitermitis]|uniref:Uncharacterized protein n=2 Tax=Paenibacillus nasutitermitis TaxID=1652958 RepID=A0A917E3Z7_9BACL|nr:hypothetical protein GCM10010911_72080 [Paenibacillus nasutitermitis]